jgi:hypothetical protein
MARAARLNSLTRHAPADTTTVKGAPRSPLVRVLEFGRSTRSRSSCSSTRLRRGRVPIRSLTTSTAPICRQCTSCSMAPLPTALPARACLREAKLGGGGARSRLVGIAPLDAARLAELSPDHPRDARPAPSAPRRRLAAACNSDRQTVIDPPIWEIAVFLAILATVTVDWPRYFLDGRPHLVLA